jgi:MYXO-CTERM domain-containing protein
MNLAFAPRGKVQLPNLVAQDIPELDVKQGVPLPIVAPTPARTPAPSASSAPVPGGAGFQQKPQGCACQAGGSPAASLLLAGSVLAIVLGRRRRTRGA